MARKESHAPRRFAPRPPPPRPISPSATRSARRQAGSAERQACTAGSAAERRHHPAAERAWSAADHRRQPTAPKHIYRLMRQNGAQSRLIVNQGDSLRAGQRRIDTMTYNDPQAAFQTAIDAGRLSTNRAAANYAGNYMYMGTNAAGRNTFKNSDSREYLA